MKIFFTTLLFISPIFSQTAIITIVSNPLKNILKAGNYYQLDGSSSSCTGGCSYRWQQLSGPSIIWFENNYTVSPKIKIKMFGEYTIRLTVSSFTTKQINITSITVGVTDYDNNGVTPSTIFSKIFGFNLGFGQSPWPWQDTVSIDIADNILQKNATQPEYVADWLTPLTGTVAVTFNNQTVTGTGTLLQTTFCSGGTISNGKEFIIFYGVNRKRNYSVVSCTSETNITIFPAIDTIDQTSTSAQYSVMAYNFIWYGGGDNINYYDNVAAFYATYYRTGLTRFLIEARRLGNLWLQNPAIDRGNRYSGPMAPATRVRAWIGLMYYLWETGQTSEWTYMYEGLDGSSLANAGLGPSADVREQSFYLGELATAILLGPDGSKSLTYIAMLEGSVYNSWNAAFNPSGYWSNKYYSNSFGGNYVINGTVTVTNGSPNIVGSGTTFTSAMCPSIPSSSMVVVLVSNDPNLNLTDTAAYACTFVDSTHITLDRPYTGSITGSGKYLAINRLVGTGIQPFILGLALGHMSIITEVVSANSANNWNNLINTSTNWLRDNARQIDTGGCYFGRISPGCEPPGLSYFGTCQYNPLITNPEGIWDSRFITGEVLTGMGKSLINTNSSTVRAEIGILLGKALGKDGGPNSDSYFAQQLFEDSFVANPSRKSLGFWFGKGNSFVSTVGYKGGPNPILGNVNYINVNLTDVPNSTSIKIYQYTPNGVVFSTQTCVSNVCSFSVNTNVINSSIIAVEYLNGSNVLRKTQIF